MSDPIEIPTDFPTVSVGNLLAFARGRMPWDREVLASIITVLAYGSSMAVAPKVIGSGAPSPLTDPAPLETKVAEALQQALDQNANQQVSMGIVPWSLIVDWAIQVLLKKVFSA